MANITDSSAPLQSAILFLHAYNLKQNCCRIGHTYWVFSIVSSPHVAKTNLFHHWHFHQMMTFTIIMIPNCIIITIIMTTMTTITTMTIIIIITTIIFMTTDWFPLPVEITKYLRLLKHKASKRLQNCFYQNHPNHQQPWHHYQQCIAM